MHFKNFIKNCRKRSLASLTRAIRRVCAMLLLLVTPIGLLHAQPQQVKPNILWITVEDITTLIGA
ncbi:MAG: hypothetical protein JO278_14230, partial [Dyella sp.]|nr:hypothetical protein [Dyella sp.]